MFTKYQLISSEKYRKIYTNIKNKMLKLVNNEPLLLYFFLHGKEIIITEKSISLEVKTNNNNNKVLSLVVDVNGLQLIIYELGYTIELQYIQIIFDDIIRYCNKVNTSLLLTFLTSPCIVWTH